MKNFYSKQRSLQIKTGIWTVVILLILVLGYLWLSNRLSMGQKYELQIAFGDVMGLEIGDKVMFRGMEVGRISSIKADSDRIICTARISSEIALKQGSQFLISDSSLMGGKALQIIQGEGLQAINKTVLQTGNSPEGVMSLITKASATLDEMKGTLQQLKAPDGLIPRSANLLNSADKAVQNTEAMAKNISNELNSAISQVDKLTTSIQQIVAENREPMSTTIAQSPALLQRINGTLDSLQLLSANLNVAANTLNTSEGTAGKLLNDKQLYDKLSASVENLDTLVKDIKAHPKKYVKFSIF